MGEGEDDDDMRSIERSSGAPPQ